MENENCKICRRAGVKLFLKGERCLSPKCAIMRRAYPPGPRGKRRKSPPSEYGRELREKQKLKNWYNLAERQFKNYIKKILGRKGKAEDAPALLMNFLELRLDNVVFRLGFASSRAHARQLVSHRYFLVNGKPINFPAHQLKKGDIVSLKSQKAGKNIFKNLKNMLKKHKVPNWLELDAQKLEGKIIGEPSLENVAPPAEISTIFEFYSR